MLTSAYEQAFVASVLAGLATGLGAIPILLGRSFPHRVFDGLVGFAAGVMLAISGHEIGEGMAGDWVGVLVAAGAGGLAVLGIRAIPGLSLPLGSLLQHRSHRVAVVILLHNLVEGLLVVATFARAGSTVGLGVAIAIAAHNVPEGLAISAPLARSGVGAWRCAALAAASGLGEPVGAILAISVFGQLLPLYAGGALAAGAMIALAATELIPEAFSHSHVNEGALGLTAGTVLTLALASGIA